MLNEQKPRVLVVENDDVVREFLEELLNDEFSVLVSSSGMEALGLLRQNKDVRVVTTSTLRGQTMNGFCLAREIKNNSPWIKVVLVSGGGEVPPRVAEYFSSIVHKPFLSSLILVIKFLLI